MTGKDEHSAPNDRPGADGRDEPQVARAEANQYKEKFLALRDKFDHVTAIHRDHEVALDAAQSKVKHLQAECDMLLDTIATHVSSQPFLMQYLEQPASHLSAPSVSHPFAPENTAPHMSAPLPNGRPQPHPANGHAHDPHVSRHDAR